MKMIVEPGRLHGKIRAIPSKSDAHRQLILASLADVPTELIMGATCEDIEATIRCLRALGAGIDRAEGGLRVTPIAEARGGEFDCGESGSTLRFLLPLIGALGARADIIAHGRLGERPNTALVAALRKGGMNIELDVPPFHLSGGLAPGTYELPGDISSQYATGLMMALPRLDGPSGIVFTSKVESQGYIDLTAAKMAQYGVAVEKTDNGYAIPGPQRYVSPGRIDVEGDWSNAAFFLAAGADVAGLDALSTQADRMIVPLIARFVREREREIDASGCPDLVPILAVMAAVWPGETRIVNAARLRIKESDRLSAMAQCLTNVGITAQELPDGLIIRGGRIMGGAVDGYNDHRIVMAMAVAGTFAEAPITISGCEAVNKSYPGFFDDFIQLGGRAHG